MLETFAGLLVLECSSVGGLHSDKALRNLKIDQKLSSALDDSSLGRYSRNYKLKRDIQTKIICILLIYQYFDYLRYFSIKREVHFKNRVSLY